MTFHELQQAIIRNAYAYGERFHITIDEDFALLKLYEEIGEFAQAILIHRKKSRPEKHMPEDKSRELVAHELADVVGMAIVLAHFLDVDLEKAFEKKWLKKPGTS